MKSSNYSALRIAYFSPLPPSLSGIADYSFELLPYLSKSLDITLFSEDPTEVDEYLRGNFSVRHIDSYVKKNGTLTFLFFRWEIVKDMRKCTKFFGIIQAL